MTVTLPQLVYECDGCGACCRHHYIEVPFYEAMREPRLTEGKLIDKCGCATSQIGQGASYVLNTPGPSGMVDGKDFGPCRFLEGDKCGIYATRPNVCAEYPPGGHSCQTRRRRAGLEPLKPRGEPTTAAEQVGVFVREFNDPYHAQALGERKVAG